jgi:hypothetical protein
MIFSSCASIKSNLTNVNCIVWKDQKIWGPYSVEVFENKAEWKGNCKSYNRNCDIVQISLDENKNVLSESVIIGSIVNNELSFLAQHVLINKTNYTAVSALMDQKKVKVTKIVNSESVIELLEYNDKCTPELAIIGAVAVGAISKFQKKE